MVADESRRTSVTGESVHTVKLTESFTGPAETDDIGLDKNTNHPDEQEKLDKVIAGTAAEESIPNGLGLHGESHIEEISATEVKPTRNSNNVEEVFQDKPTASSTDDITVAPTSDPKSSYNLLNGHINGRVNPERNVEQQPVQGDSLNAPNADISAVEAAATSDDIVNISSSPKTVNANAEPIRIPDADPEHASVKAPATLVNDTEEVPLVP